MDKLSIVVPVFNQIIATFGQWGTLRTSVDNWDNVELVIVDNGSTDRTEELLRRFITRGLPHVRYIKNAENKGFSEAVNQGLAAAGGDIIMAIHNDLYIYEHGWVARVLSLFRSYPDLGLAGFVGAKTALADGGRNEVLSNLIDAEQHSMRFEGDHAVTLFDSLCLIARKQFWRQTSGLDTEYGPNHWTDKDISLKSLSLGLANRVIGISCYHAGGITACSPQYQEWVGNNDHDVWKAGRQRYLAKWGHMLPRSI